MKMTKKLLLWLDIETTGLDPHHDHILEVGMQVTDLLGVHVGVKPLTVTVTPNAWRLRRLLLQNAGSLNIDATPSVPTMHRRNGLLDETFHHMAMSEKQAKKLIRDYVRALTPTATVYLAGSSVDFDRRFLTAWDSHLLEGVHHRILDVSSLILALHALDDWADTNFVENLPKSTTNHRVQNCLQDSKDTYAKILTMVRIQVDYHRSMRTALAVLGYEMSDAEQKLQEIK